MRRFLRSIIYIGAACAMVPFTPLVAQSPSGPPAVAAPHKTHWCFRGRPKPTCDNFWITEFGFAKGVTNDQPDDSGGLLTWELGWMVNRGTRTALGMAAFFQGRTGDGIATTGIGIRPRFRWWMNRTISVDFAPGIVLHGSGPGPGFSGNVGFNFGDHAALTAHVVGRPYAQSTRPEVFIGGRLGFVWGAFAIVWIAIRYIGAALEGPD